MQLSDEVKHKASNVKLLVLDVDGVLTDGRIVYTDQGQQVQSFHVKDGLGIKLLALHGIKSAVISARKSKALEKRCAELGISHVFQAVAGKVECLNELLIEFGLDAKQVCAIGDDWVDLPLLKRCGLAVTVADSATGMKEHVDYVTKAPGGQGAVREVCELILMSKGLLEKSFQLYLNSAY
ncbi:MAG: HAD-IIIA family hydrolase [Thermodesulfobacteria bacterium]|nr:HAD-IIIA family hydrolase [Thermodesulfobacteriota bacterium]